MACVLMTVVALSVPAMASFEVMTGAYTSCFLDDGEVKCWGNNGNGQLGVGDTDTRFEPLAGFIDLGTDRLGDRFMADSVECGSGFCCALSEEVDPSVKCMF